MAAALIPLAISLAPDLIKLIVSLIHPKATAAEALGTGTGAVKFADVFVGVMSDLAKAHAAGTIAGVPDDATVKIIIQAVVTSMQLLGLLGGTAMAAPAPTQTAGQTTWSLHAGSSILVTA